MSDPTSPNPPGQGQSGAPFPPPPGFPSGAAPHQGPSYRPGGGFPTAPGPVQGSFAGGGFPTAPGPAQGSFPTAFPPASAAAPTGPQSASGRRKRAGKWTTVQLIVLAVAMVASCGIGAAIGGASGSSNDGTTPTAAGGVTVTKTVTEAAAPGESKPTATPKPTASAKPTAKPTPTSNTVLSTKGSGIKNTAKFTTGDDWTIHWTYNCSNFGTSGNFQVMVYTDGELDTVAVNELGKKGSDSSPMYGDSGTHYLSVNSECSWTVKVTKD